MILLGSPTAQTLTEPKPYFGTLQEEKLVESGVGIGDLRLT